MVTEGMDFNKSLQQESERDREREREREREKKKKDGEEGKESRERGKDTIQTKRQIDTDWEIMDRGKTSKGGNNLE